MGSKNKKPPKFEARELPAEEGKSTDRQRPVFCLEHIRQGFDLKNPGLSQSQRAAFAERLQELAAQTWGELKLNGRHGQGFELLPVTRLKVSMPPAFEDATNVLVFRYHQKLPMVGVRLGATLHILAVERHFGDLYDH